MSSTIGRSPANPASATSRNDLIETALDALRREWKNGFNARALEQMAIPMIGRLRDLAATQHAANELSGILGRLERYRELPIERRKTELVELANAIKAIAPELRLAAEPAQPVGKLREALVPAKPTPKPAQRSAPVVRAAPPESPITELPRVGEAVAKKLANLHVARIIDLLNLSPRRHIDYTRTVKIGSIIGFGQREEVTVRGEILDLKEIPGPGSTRVTIRLGDDTGWVRITWFNSYIARQIQPGMQIAVSGLLDKGYGPPSFTNPEWEIVGGPSLSTGRLTPVYPLTQGIAQKTMRSLTRAALDATANTLLDPLPADIRDRERLVSLPNAFESLHYPDTWGDLEAAQTRLAFDNLLLLQLGLIARKQQRATSTGVALTIDRALLTAFEAQLPFELTRAQRAALSEILSDLGRRQPMARLLQGDVGSGKTAVAAAATLIAVASGYQVAVMAPTEILAEQHFHNFQGLLAGLDEAHIPSVALLTGSTRAKDRRDILPRVESGELDILVGTHALIQETVAFKRLGLAVIDEQHRFGVRQRSNLPGKADGAQPHILSMTATPIPRTLNMVLNGDMDVSIIDELPPGRIPVETRRYVGAERALAYQLVRQEVGKGHQVFVICPLVEESEMSEQKAAVAEAERLRIEVFPDYRIATLHGRMSGREKDRIMTAFRDHEFDVLVSTSVIEVGIDVPNATVMLIEGADRFGLSQLHQFRGRVGRGGARSYCLLLADESSPDGEARLELMVETNDGFTLAEKDLELRGPGDFLGTRQSGLPEMTWIDGSFDTRLLDRARLAAESILAADPTLERPEHRELKRRLDALWSSVQTDTPLPT
ncbi:MAG: ATP-dependent DNA helicase RecG [Thermomicrobiales bacterium]|nr:ATP-dependent DNA helicase RecG [Thermomicrobiales bacterium]